MKNKYFKDEDISANDVLFVCAMVERVARRVHRRNRDVVNAMGADGLAHELSCAPTSHCENPEKVVADWIARYRLTLGETDVLKVNPRLVTTVPTPVQMGGVYQRLIRDTAMPGENENDGILRVYNHPICDVIDDYNASAYYEPSYWLAAAYRRNQTGPFPGV